MRDWSLNTTPTRGSVLPRIHRKGWVSTVETSHFSRREGSDTAVGGTSPARPLSWGAQWALSSPGMSWSPGKETQSHPGALKPSPCPQSSAQWLPSGPRSPGRGGGKRHTHSLHPWGRSRQDPTWRQFLDL